MFHIYVLLYVTNFSDSLPREMYLFYIAQSMLLFNANCLIHGLVWDESDKLFHAMDSMNPRAIKRDIPSLTEIMIFISMKSDNKCGFSIGGLIPFRKTTLLSVNVFN